MAAAKQHNLNDPLAGALQWDYGTAYEFLLSMDTLFRPKVHGLAAPWAAGVRKRLTAQSQGTLKGFYALPFSMSSYMPLHLVLEMPTPKDAAHLLDYIEAIPGDDFIRRMHTPLVGDAPPVQVMRRAVAGEKPTDADLEEYRKGVGRARILPAPSVADTRRLFAEVANSAGTKKKWLSAMREYYAVYFAEEEKRLAPVLKKMV